MAARAKKPPLTLASAVMKRHFPRLALDRLIVSNREYPVPARVDLQRALDDELRRFPGSRQLGIHCESSYETLTLGHLLGNHHSRVVVGPLQFDEIDLGEAVPARCVQRAMWLATDGRMPFAVILGPVKQVTVSAGTNLEIAVPPGEQGERLARSLLDAIELRVRGAASYRGRVISLEQTDRYSGAMGSIRVHKLRRVMRDQIVLPLTTLAMLDRNVLGFVAQRARLKALGMPGKKGLLFHGKPGTGKTHTIHYLADALPHHTTLLITAEQVGILHHYFQLARFLQPAIMVIEDADLIARSREQMSGACGAEVLLNQLLNEMDGLREDAEILFILTTNRPDELEAALAARPGRIDQAIEFPLPDEDGRLRLIHLYAGGLQTKPGVAEDLVRLTEGGSAAFIKELMRRAAQFLLEQGGETLERSHVEAALGEMLFGGGSLNLSLLGAAASETELTGFAPGCVKLWT